MHKSICAESVSKGVKTRSGPMRRKDESNLHKITYIIITDYSIQANEALRDEILQLKDK